MVVSYEIGIFTISCVSGKDTKWQKMLETIIRLLVWWFNIDFFFLSWQTSSQFCLFLRLLRILFPSRLSLKRLGKMIRIWDLNLVTVMTQWMNLSSVVHSACSFFYRYKKTSRVFIFIFWDIFFLKKEI